MWGCAVWELSYVDMRGEWRLSAFECSAPSYGEEDDPGRKAQGDGTHVPACRWAPLLTIRCYIYYYKYDIKVLEKE